MNMIKVGLGRKRRVFRLIAIGMVMATLCVFVGFLPTTAAKIEKMIDLTGTSLVEENLKENRDMLYDCARLSFNNNGWVSTFSLFNVTSPLESPNPPGYFIWKVKVGAHRSFSMEMNFRDWTGVGNGGVVGNNQPKLAFYYTMDMNAALDGSVSGWKTFGTNVAWDMSEFDYTVPLDYEFTEDTEMYVMIRCCSTGDGAWIDKIVFQSGTDKEVPLQSIRLDHSTLELPFGREYHAKVTYEPKDTTDRELIWSSDNPAVTVSDKGVIFATAEGEATVTAKNKDGTVSAVCHVTVPKGSEEQVLLTEEWNADLLNTKADPYRLPGSWYFNSGSSETSTAVVTWGDTVFRDFGSYAEVIYKIVVPAERSVQMQLSMVTDYYDGKDLVNGVVGVGNLSNLPRLNIYVCDTRDGNVQIDRLEEAPWRRIDRDDQWSGNVADYIFRVADPCSEERVVYVRLVSTYVSGQGAWMRELSFAPAAPTPLSLIVKAPSRVCYHVGEAPDLRGLCVGVRYSDGSVRMLRSDEYVVSPSDALSSQDTELTVQFGKSALSATVPITILAEESTPTPEWILPLAILLGVAIVGGVGVIWFRKYKKNEKG